MSIPVPSVRVWQLPQTDWWVPPHPHHQVLWKHALMRTGQPCLDLRNRLQAQQVAIVAETLHAHARKMPTLKKHRLNLRHSPTERTVGGNYCIAFRQTQGPEQRQQAPAMVTA